MLLMSRPSPVRAALIYFLLASVNSQSLSHPPTPTPSFTPGLMIAPPAYIVSTVAGDGTSGTGYCYPYCPHFGDGGPAIEAVLNYPSGVFVTPAGNVFIADTWNHVVRFLNTSTGNITTYVGSGWVEQANSADPSGDGGPATSAKMTYPTAIAADVVGNLYVSEYSGSRVRLISKSTNIITTFAGTGVGGFTGDGGPATLAKLNIPSGLAVDTTSGIVYIAESYNQRVRGVSTNGTIFTKVGLPDQECNTYTCYFIGGFGGDGGLAVQAKLRYPVGLALEGGKLLYIADKANNRIRVVQLSTGVISTFAGSGATGNAGSYSGDGGLAVLATLNNPDSVAVDVGGNIWISDTYNSVIRYVAKATGVINTVAGNSMVGYNGDGMIATSSRLSLVKDSNSKGLASAITIGPSGTIWVADTNNQRIRMLTPCTISRTPTSKATPSSSYTAVPTLPGPRAPKWAQMGGTAQHTGRSPYVGTASATLLWSFAAFGGGTVGWPYPTYDLTRASRFVGSSPAIGADGTLIVTTGASVFALSGSTGEVIWRYSPFTDSDLRVNPEFCLFESTPAIGFDNTVYGSTNGYVFALNGSTGNQVWKTTVHFFVDSSPVLGPDGTVYVAVGDWTGALYALNGATGNVMWSFQQYDAPSSPAVSENGRFVYVVLKSFYGTTCNLWAINSATGSNVWSFPLNYGSDATPTIGPGGTLYILDYREMLAINGVTGALIWRKSDFKVGDGRASPAIGSGGKVYVAGDDGFLYALNGATGSLLWSYLISVPIYTLNTPAIDAVGTVFVGSYDTNVYALNGATGELIWNYTTGGMIRSSAAIGAGGTIYIGGSIYSDDILMGSYLYAIGTPPSKTPTPSKTPSSAATCSHSTTSSISETKTPSSSSTSSTTGTSSFTQTQTPTGSKTSSLTASSTDSSTQTPSGSETPSNSATLSVTPVGTQTPTVLAGASAISVFFTSTTTIAGVAGGGGILLLLAGGVCCYACYARSKKKARARKTFLLKTAPTEPPPPGDLVRVSFAAPGATAGNPISPARRSSIVRVVRTPSHEYSEDPIGTGSDGVVRRSFVRTARKRPTLTPAITPPPLQV